MHPVLIGQLLGISFACGLNLYATIAALGLLSRIGLIQELPPALRGLESAIVIGTALTLYVVEAIIDRVSHADSIWDSVHTIIRPTAAAFLAVGVMWTEPLAVQASAAGLAFAIALAAHGAKAGLRVTLNTSGRNGRTARISTVEDMAAVVFVFGALRFPVTSLVAGAAVLAILAFFGPRLWRAFGLGLRCIAAWFRTLFVKAGWRERHDLPARFRGLLGEPSLGAGPPRGARAAVKDLPGVPPYRNGWLVMTERGPVFLYGRVLRVRRAPLPDALSIERETGPWVHTLRIQAHAGDFTLYLLKDGPPVDVIVEEMQAVAP